MYQRTMTGEPAEEIKQTMTEINKRELIAISPLIAVIIALGFVPQVALNVINPAVSQVQDYVDVQDSQPAINSIGLAETAKKVGA
jgi:NADH-quinone oxidoreductase subunit M